MLWDVVVLGFRINATLPPRQLVERVLAISEAEAREFVKRLPRVARAGLSRADADKLLAALQAVGAKAEIREHGKAEIREPAKVEVVTAPKAARQHVVVREVVAPRRAQETRLINSEISVLAARHEQAAARGAMTLRSGGAGEAAAALEVAAHAAVARTPARDDAPVTMAAVPMAAAVPIETGPDNDGDERWSSHMRIKSLFPGELDDDPAKELSFSLPPVEAFEPVVQAEPSSAMLQAAAGHEFGGLDLRPFLPAASAVYDEVTARAKERLRPSAPEPKAQAAAPSVSTQDESSEEQEASEEEYSLAPVSEHKSGRRGLHVALVAGSLLFALLALAAVLLR